MSFLSALHYRLLFPSATCAHADYMCTAHAQFRSAVFCLFFSATACIRCLMLYGRHERRGRGGKMLNAGICVERARGRVVFRSRRELLQNGLRDTRAARLCPILSGLYGPIRIQLAFVKMSFLGKRRIDGQLIYAGGSRSPYVLSRNSTLSLLACDEWPVTNLPSDFLYRRFFGRISTKSSL